jgi:hypothetical protein
MMSMLAVFLVLAGGSALPSRPLATGMTHATKKSG